MSLRSLVDKLLGKDGKYTPMTPSGSKGRVRESFVMTSPALDTFTPKWAGDDRSKEKMLGMFQYARIKGTVVQDLGEGSVSYPLTLYFDGPDHDLEAQRFWQACSQSGVWDIMHPTKGFVGLQLMRVSEQIQPVKASNQTTFTTEWIEPIDPVTLKTVAQMAAEAGMKLNEFNDVAASEFAGKISAGSLAERMKIAAVVGKVTGAMDKTLGPIAEAVVGINEAFDAVLRGVQDVLSATILDPLALASQIQMLAQLPMLATQDIRGRLSAYNDLCVEIFGIELDDINGAAVRELSLNAITGGLSRIATTGTDDPAAGGSALRSKAQVVNAIETIDAQYAAILTQLDTDAVQLPPFPSQVTTFTPGLLLIGLGIRYMLDAFYNLRIEKVFILDVPSTPIRLAVENYGNAEAGLGLLIQSNALKGDRLIWLPAGTEVVIYA
jgi:hypothetical protein